jgi:hypothetical protein
MINACYPLSRKYSPMAQPEYGAKNYSGAASEAVAATTIVYSKAPLSLRVFFYFIYR